MTSTLDFAHAYFVRVSSDPGQDPSVQTAHRSQEHRPAACFYVACRKSRIPCCEDGLWRIPSMARRWPKCAHPQRGLCALSRKHSRTTADLNTRVGKEGRVLLGHVMLAAVIAGTLESIRSHRCLLSLSQVVPPISECVNGQIRGLPKPLKISIFVVPNPHVVSLRSTQSCLSTQR